MFGEKTDSDQKIFAQKILLLFFSNIFALSFFPKHEILPIFYAFYHHFVQLGLLFMFSLFSKRV